MHKSGRLVKNGEGLGAFITWMTSGEHEVDVGGGGDQLAELHTGSSVQALYHVFGLQTLAWSKLLVLTGKKLAFKFSTYIFECRPLPPCPPRIHLASTWWMFPGLPHFSPVFHSHVLLWTQTEGENGRVLGTRLSPVIVIRHRKAGWGLGMRLIRHRFPGATNCDRTKLFLRCFVYMYTHILSLYLQLI